MGRFKTPEGVTVNVDDELAEKIGGKWSPISEGDADRAGTPAKSETPDKSWTLGELKTYAVEHDVDLEGAKKKDEIITAIAASESHDDSDDDDSDDDSNE